MNIQLPTPGGGYTTGLLATIFRTISTALYRAMPVDEAVPSFILLAPNGTRWRITVSNTGVLTATAI